MTDDEKLNNATLDHAIDYVKLMLGAPVVEPLLSDERISKCVLEVAKFITDKVAIDNASDAWIRMTLERGAYARAKYMTGKLMFRRLNMGVMDMGPEEDGWDLMCEGSGEWDEFKATISGKERL